MAKVGRPGKSISLATLKIWESAYGSKPIPLPVIAMEIYGSDDRQSVNNAWKIMSRRGLAGETLLYKYKDRPEEKVKHYQVEDLQKAFS